MAHNSAIINTVITNNLLTLEGTYDPLATSITLEIFDSSTNSVFTRSSDIDSGWTRNAGAWQLDVSALSLSDGAYYVKLTSIDADLDTQVVEPMLFANIVID